MRLSMLMVLTSLLVACPSSPDVEPMGTSEGSAGSDASGSQADTAPPAEGGNTFPIPMCECSTLRELAPVPSACVDLQVPAFNGQSRVGWIVNPSTIITATHEGYFCQDLDLSFIELGCPCTNWLYINRYDFAALPLEVGETTAVLATADAACGDICEYHGSAHDPDQYSEIPVQIIAVSDTCIIGETTNLSPNERFYVGRQACP